MWHLILLVPWANQLTIRANAYDANDGKLLNGRTGINIAYQRVSGPANVTSSGTVATSPSGPGEASQLR